MWTTLVVLILAGVRGLPPQPATPVIEAKRVDAVVVPEGSQVRLEGKTGKLISEIFNPDETVVRINPRGHFVRFEALTAGVARLKLTDVDGKVDEVVVVVVKTPKK